MIRVKVQQLNGTLETTAVQEGTHVADVLEGVNLNDSLISVTTSGSSRDVDPGSTILVEGDIVTWRAKGLKGA